MQIYTAKKKAAGVDIFAPYRAKAYAKKRARIAAGEIPASVWTEARANAALKRKALKLGATTEDFTRLEVFERDGWTCGLCGEPVDRELKWPDPMSPSLDHVIPLIKGGDHSRANTQCSHLTCNVRKHDRILT